MRLVLRMVHLVALGLWLGGITFFSFCTALPIINNMQELAARPDNWLGLKDRKEGIRLAGEALTPVFNCYFAYQAACGAVAVLSAAAWWRCPETVPKFRVLVLAAALTLVLVNLTYLSQEVHRLRKERYAADPVVVANAERVFSTWHNYSLAADMTTLALVALGMAMGAVLPPSGAERRQENPHPRLND